MKHRARRFKQSKRKILGTSAKPRLMVFRSNKHIYAQVIDDIKGITIDSFSDLKLSSQERKGNKVEMAGRVGVKLGEKLKKGKIGQVFFDRGHYKYHGRIKALAEGVRKAGIKF